MDISVIVCTYNRSLSLATALESIAASVVPEFLKWEVVVVDNNSSDATKAAVESVSHKFPGRFRYLFEPQQGKSFALNAGIREARGEILAFVDDDVIVEPTWLHNLTADLHDGKWAGTGGRILPPKDFVPPRWLALSGPRNLGIALCAQFDFGPEPFELKDAPFGTNMAFRKEMFERYGGFRVDLGPRPGSEIRNEDTEIGRRLMAGGERLRYVPSAIVYHEVHPSRVRKQFFLAWWLDLGRATIREAEKLPAPREIARFVGRTCPTVVGWLISPDPERRFYRKCTVWHTVGKLLEIKRRIGAPVPQAKS